ncbi:MAG: hypothetical protein NC300_07845 [Bacteroidales bacterium]|nr:hypothetical protein [Clostridium sp.]MCM1204042.1 hypothetical protein [Bacteroidales bacterium]
MISKILIMVFTLVIFTGLFGIRAKTLGGRMLFLCVSEFGSAALAFCQLNAYGLLGGIMQSVFRLISLLLLVVMFKPVCKSKQIFTLRDIDGMGKQKPYLFAAVTVLSMIAIGIPATGTFTGILYSEVGLLAGGYGVFTYVGLLANMAGIAVPAALLLPILSRAYFPGAENGVETAKAASCTPLFGDMVQWGCAGKGLTACYLGISLLLVIFCIYQKPVMAMGTKLIEKIFG